MSVPAYEHYRDSGVDWLGEVPSHWTSTKVKYACRLTTGWTPPTGKDEYYGDEYPWANISDLGPREVFETSKGVTQKAVDDAGATISPRGSLLFSFKLSVGQVSFAGRDIYTNEAIATFHTGSLCDLRYGYFALPLFLLKNAAENIYGAKLLNQQLMGAALLCLPPAAEQTAIAAFLDRETAKIDALVEEQRRLIDLLKEKRQAVISHAVTKGLDSSVPMKDSGVEWLGEVPAHWNVRPLSSLCREGTSITYGIIQAGPHVEGGVPYIRTGDMSGESLPLSGYQRTSHEIDAGYGRSKVRAGDLVIAIRATIGKPLEVPEELDGANLTQGTARFAPGVECTSKFIRYCLLSKGAAGEFERLSKGATFKEITLEALRKFRVPCPPLDEQKQLVVRTDQECARLDALLQAAELAIDLLRERRSAVISCAVTGKIDVRDFVPATSKGEIV